MSTRAYSTFSAPGAAAHNNPHSRPPTRQSAPSIPEFFPRQPASTRQPRHRQCSHQSDSGQTVCGLEMLNERPPPLKEDRSESLSSTGSSSSLHTQPRLGGVFGQGHGWLQDTAWYPPPPPASISRKSSQSDKDDFHLVSMADEYEVDRDPIFNPSLAKLSLSDKPMPPTPSTDSPIGPASLTSEQLAKLVAGYPSGAAHSPAVAHLVARSTRLAKGLAHPPPNRGFRPKANEVHDHDESNTTVFVGGLSQGVTESTLSEIFAPFGSIAYVKVPPGKGCGFVQFYSKQDAEYAIKQMQGFECMGCSLRTHWGKSQSDRSSPASPASAPSEHVVNQVASICAALGVPREHSELVMRVLNACNASEGGTAVPEH